MPVDRTRFQRPIGLVTAALLGTTLIAFPARDARADEVSPTGKGIVGGGLLGAEVVTITEALAGTRPAWAYAVGAVVGAGGGAVAGHFIEDASFSQDGRVPMYMLAGGLALVIPAIVLSLNATRYLPDEGATEDRVSPTPAAEPGSVGGSVVGPPSVAPAAPPSTPAPVPPGAAPTPPPPQSLFDVHEGSFRMGVPVPDVRQVFSLTEQRQYGMHAQTELRMPMVHVTF